MTYSLAGNEHEKRATTPDPLKMRDPSRHSTRLLKAALLQLILLVSCIQSLTLTLEEGAACKLHLEDAPTLGTCVLVTQCLPALKSIRVRHQHDFVRCGFNDRIEIVCCPNTSVAIEQPPHNDGGGSNGDMDSSDVSTYSPNDGSTTSKAEVRGPVIRKSAQVCEDFAHRLGPKLSYQILAGEDVRPGEFPHMAALGYEGDGGGGSTDELMWQCGGSLISERYVLTAAHCIVKQDGKPPIRIRLGKADIVGNSDNATAVDFGIVNITVHPQYNRRAKRHDIALIKLDGDAPLTNFVNPACLYNKGDDPSQGLVITGWGAIRIAGEMHNILQKGYLVPVPLDQCNTSYASSPLKVSIHGNQFCAMSSDGKTDACQGDSGGPLQVQSVHASSIYSIVGVTSFGRGCGGSYPGIYTRVYNYLDWIEGIVWSN